MCKWTKRLPSSLHPSTCGRENRAYKRGERIASKHRITSYFLDSLILSHPRRKNMKTIFHRYKKEAADQMTNYRLWNTNMQMCKFEDVGI